MSELKFDARIAGNTLIAYASLESRNPVFSLNVSDAPSFWIEESTLMVNLNTGISHPVYRAWDYKAAEQLLSVVTDTLSKRKPPKKWKEKILLGAAILFMGLIGWRYESGMLSLPAPHYEPSSSQGVPAEHSAAHFQGLPQLRDKTPGNPYFGNNTASALNAGDGQPAPASAPIQPSATKPASVANQETLIPNIMQNLKKAAARGYFTVPLSSGHARTLYVFADPDCPNCRSWEPVIEALANEYNVEIFPVSAIGQEKSMQQIQPVLYLDKEQRAAAWKKLFSIDDGMLTIAKKNTGATDKNETPAKRDDKRWKIAGEALAINDVAFKQYRIPGTPWVIADDGRHVSQSMMKDPATLRAFISDKNNAGD
ncbi:thioredoxin fold domain-containing protein [Serratia ficaria]|uniref:thioredoxin fold domain-containing protein n=1 Tax=Serratia ficaria TaxID=61651 RepID=UPI00077C6BDF|nr:thioredoxin fold domain-containing protein [Serratia ficaria]